MLDIIEDFSNEDKSNNNSDLSNSSIFLKKDESVEKFYKETSKKSSEWSQPDYFIIYFNSIIHKPIIFSNLIL